MLRHRILGFREESELPNEMISKCPTLTETSVGEATTQSSFVKFMADGMKARLQRLNLFNSKQEQKDVS